MTGFWTPAKLDVLKELADGTRSARQVAESLGCSRNMVIGMIHRGKGRYGRLDSGSQAGRSVAVKPRAAGHAGGKPGMPPLNFRVVQPALPQARHAETASPQARNDGSAPALPGRTVLAMLAGADAPVAPGSDGLGFLLPDLRAADCRFPLSGEGAATRFCAVEVEDWEPGSAGRSGASYCLHHRALCSAGRPVRKAA